MTTFNDINRRIQTGFRESWFKFLFKKTDLAKQYDHPPNKTLEFFSKPIFHHRG